MNRNCVITLLALGACTSPESSSPPPPKPPAANADLSSMDLEVQSQEEADSEAQKSIDEKNADAALDELEQEIEGGPPPKQAPMQR